MSYVGNQPAQTTIPVDDSVTTIMLQDDAVTSAKIAGTTIVNADINASAGIALSKLASDPTYDDASLQDDVALLGFRVASNGSLAKYNLVDQTVDDFQDTSGVDASASTNEIRDSSGKYYHGGVTVTPSSSGGSATTDGSDTIHTFTASGTYTIDTAVDHHFLVVAGGGGGGGSTSPHGYQAGGGGAGGYRTSYSTSGGGASAESQLSMAAASFTVTVGAKGIEGPQGDRGTDGGDSIVSTITSAGGGAGGGGGNTSSETAGNDGGSGGGAGGRNTTTSAGGAGTANQGYLGGDAPSGTGAGGSGGGASAIGVTSASAGHSATGGAGLANTISGSSVTYAKGGNSREGTNTGGVNTGEGGGGGLDATGADGGTGIVILRRVTSTTSDANLTLISTTTAAQAAPTKGDVVFTYTNGAGTTTLGTDVTAEISADGGSTWTAMTLGSEGSTGSHNIATSHDVTITSTITSPWNMAYRIKTLNQSASKTTRIQAVSLGWS